MAFRLRFLASIVVALLALASTADAAQGYDSTTGASPMPAQPDVPASEESMAPTLESYSQQCVARIQRLMAAQSPDMEDDAVSVQAVRIARDGRVLSIDTVGQTSHPDLDRFARRVIQQASPFPPVPEAVADDRESVTIELGFTVREGSVRVE